MLHFHCGLMHLQVEYTITNGRSHTGTSISDSESHGSSSPCSPCHPPPVILHSLSDAHDLALSVKQATLQMCNITVS